MAEGLDEVLCGSLERGLLDEERLHLRPFLADIDLDQAIALERPAAVNREDGKQDYGCCRALYLHAQLVKLGDRHRTLGAAMIWVANDPLVTLVPAILSFRGVEMKEWWTAR